MGKEYILLKNYTTRLVEKGTCLPDIGLWSGKMGIAIYLLYASQITKSKEYEHEASKLIDAVYKQLSLNLPLTFDNGLIGIGCGFEHIICKGFVNADSDDILSEIDIVAKSIIDSRSINDLDFGKGICGIGYYLYHRLRYRNNDDKSMIVLKLKEYLIYLIDWLEEQVLKTVDKQGYNDAYFLLARLYKLNVFNHKVERLATMCLRKMIDFNCRVVDNYELLGIPSLKVLKPWI